MIPSGCVNKNGGTVDIFHVPELFPKTFRWFCCGAEQCWFVAVGIPIDSIHLRAESPNLGVLYFQAKSSCLQTRQDWIIYLIRRWKFRQQTHTCNLSTWQHRDLQSEYGCLIWQMAFSRNLILENPLEKITSIKIDELESYTWMINRKNVFFFPLLGHQGYSSVTPVTLVFWLQTHWAYNASTAWTPMYKPFTSGLMGGWGDVGFMVI